MHQLVTFLSFMFDIFACLFFKYCLIEPNIYLVFYSVLNNWLIVTNKYDYWMILRCLIYQEEYENICPSFLFFFFSEKSKKYVSLIPSESIFQWITVVESVVFCIFATKLGLFFPSLFREQGSMIRFQVLFPKTEV